MRLILIGSILLSTAVHSHAVTLGRHGGAAVIGRALDIRVEALVSPGEDVSALCVRAEVFYGDSQLASSAVRLAPQRAAPDAKASIRVQTTVPVNEPVVSVLVYAGCDAPFSRRYVLLADPVIEPSSEGMANGKVSTSLGLVGKLGVAKNEVSSVPPLAGGKASSDRNAAARATPQDVSLSEETSSGAEPLPPAKIANNPPRKATNSKPESVVRKPVAEAAPVGPRLQLDPLDTSLGFERDPVLKLSLSMLSEPTASEEERAAAVRLWKAINATPEEILRDSQKLAVLEAESKGLREQESRDKAAIQAMQAKLDQTRNITWLAYLLGALLVLSLLGLWFFRRRKADAEVSKRAGAWWDGDQQKPSMGGRAAVAGAAGIGASPSQRRDHSGDLDVALDLNLDSGFNDYDALHDSSLQAVLIPTAGARVEDDQQAIGSRSLATEELFDIQQQADFFVSLGETDKAIGVLKNHLLESLEPSALAYLDLFKLYHSQGNSADYEVLREEFNLKFNAGAPPFDHYTDSSVGLEGYQTAFSRIQALWPQPRVLDVIEKSIFRDADDKNGEVFDLEAYRELLLLYAVAKEMIQEGDEVPHADFEHTAIKPLKAVTSVMGGTGGPDTEPFGGMSGTSSSLLGLDVDLDALCEMSAFEASLPEVNAVVEASAASNDRAAKNVADEGNLIDFEVMDFMPPDDTDSTPEKGR